MNSPSRALASTAPLLQHPIGYHEAGHACVAQALGIPVREAALYEDGRGATSLADVRICDIPPDAYVLMLLSGDAADRHVQPMCSVVDFGSQDRKRAREIVAIGLLKPHSPFWPSADEVSTELD